MIIESIVQGFLDVILFFIGIMFESSPNIGRTGGNIWAGISTICNRIIESPYYDDLKSWIVGSSIIVPWDACTIILGVSFSLMVWRWILFLVSWIYHKIRG